MTHMVNTGGTAHGIAVVWTISATLLADTLNSVTVFIVLTISIYQTLRTTNSILTKPASLTIIISTTFRINTFIRVHVTG